MDVNINIPKEWRDYVTQINLGLEVVPSVLYSVKSYVSHTSQVLTFFDFVRGSRPDLTNMQQPNMLPNPESFLIQNIRIFNWGNVNSADSGIGDCGEIDSQFNEWVELVKRGILELKIGNKQYGPWPLWMLPANSFVKGGFSTGSDLLADYGQVDGALYPLIPNLMIAPLQQFTVTLSWPGGPVTLCPDLDDEEAPTELPIEILFDGQLARSIQ